MKTLDDWIAENFSEEEKAKIDAEVLREAEAIKSANEMTCAFIRGIMTEKGIGFNEFARQTKLSPSHLQSILKGKTSPTVATLAKICAVFEKRLAIG